MTPFSKLCFISLLLASLSSMAAEPLVPAGSKWQYNDKGEELAGSWTEIDFDDSSWSSGEARFGYGGDGEKTTIGFGADGNNKHITTYFRKFFTVGDAKSIKKLKLNLVRDDGAVIYLNGREIHRSNMPQGKVEKGTLASGTVGNADEKKSFEASVPAEHLVTGKNIIAVEIHQAAPTSTDLGFDLEVLPE